MRITTHQYAQGLYEALREVKPEEHDKVIDNLVEVLRKNNELDKFQAVVSAYESLDLEQQGIKQAEVTFARDVEMNKTILEELNTVAGSKLQVEKKVDEEIIGGVVIRVDDTLIDASVKGQLNTLKESLSK